jgi:hypothetical protein
MKKHPPSRRARVDRFGKGDEVSVVIAEEVAEILNLTEIAREPGEFAKKERFDVATLHVCHHPFGFRMLHNGFA